ncbi:MAG: ABC transporter ATP-binding protein [Candidatus Ventricola sp.]
MIEVKRLCAGYRGRPVLDGITLEIRPGEVLALLGPNGCGKSTLLRAVLGLCEVTGGEVLVGGTPANRLRRRELARRVSLLAQSRSVPVITALRMALHGRFPYLGYPRQYGREDIAIARRALARAGAAELEQAVVSELSGGQRQSVYVAMTLAQDTPAVLMDEPTNSLDIARQLELLSTARALAHEGRAVALVLHDIPLALRTADRVAVMQAGRLIACDTPEGIARSGVIDRVFGIRLCAAQTPHGTQYYCVPASGAGEEAHG